MKKFLIVVATILSLVFIFCIYIIQSSRIADPAIDMGVVEGQKLATTDGRLYHTQGGWIQQNDKNLYELFVEGNPLELGYRRGLLSESVIYNQESLFIERIKELIPSKTYLMFLKYIVSWFNRNLPDYIEPEFLIELYGVSRFASDEFDFIGSKYQRILNYHAAHDIGHALQNYQLVGCTSFSTWKNNGEDLIVGRNFDFSMGEKFSENKIICFYHPENGIPFATITWSDFIGNVSGMNLEGLTVTINAGENSIPTQIGTPISLISREILQYAKTIQEAFNIAASRQSFVSESILIGSANDGSTAIIEKTPDTTILVTSASNRIICSNHFQSKELSAGKSVSEITSASHYRYLTIENALNEMDSANEMAYAQTLRKITGLNGADIGLGNEKSVNQLVAHHAVIFKPNERKMWVSTPPYQLGDFLCYDLNKVFSEYRNLKESAVIYESSESIAKDAFLTTDKYQKFMKWKSLKAEIVNATQSELMLDELKLREFENDNAQHFITHEILGDYYAAQGDKEKSLKYYSEALTKELSNPSDLLRINEKLDEVD